MTGPTMRPMGIGEILDRSFQVLRRHLGTLVVTALIGTAPMLLLSALTGGPYGVDEPLGAGRTAAILVNLTFMMLITVVVWAALVHQVDQALSGRRVSVGSGLRNGLGALLRLIGVGILAYLALLGMLLPVGILAALSAGFLTAGGAATIITAAALLLAAAAALVVYSGIIFLIVPALMIEALGPIRALRRANELAKGGRIRVFATAFLSWIVVLLPTIGIPAMLGLGLAVWDPQAAGEMTTTQAYLNQVLMLGVSALTTPFMAAVMVHTYYDRRVRREGYDVELAAKAMPASA